MTEEGERKKRKQQEGKRTVDEKKKNKKKKKKEKKEKPGSEAAGLLCVYNLKEVFLESLMLLIACKAYALYQPCRVCLHYSQESLARSLYINYMTDI